MDRTKELGELLRTAGYKMRSKLIHDEFDGREGKAFWEVTFRRNGCEHTFTYHNAVVARYFPRGGTMSFHHIDRMTVAQFEANKQTKPMKPTYAGCMCLLQASADAVRNGETLEEYCAYFSNNPADTRAKVRYLECITAWEGLDRLGADYDELNRLFEDF